MIKDIQSFVKTYIIDNKIQSLVIGISGGIDSTTNAALLRPICDELNIPLIGRYIHIESNKEIEKKSAELVGNAFCDNFELVDLTSQYNHFMSEINLGKNVDTNSYDYKIRCGNIKARMRMMFLRDVTQENRGLMVDNSNWTERMLGFFTVSDNGDISPMMHLCKTDVYNVAIHLSKMYSEKEDTRKSQAIDFSISLIPTDGLGISSSDLEQIGAKSYEQVDNILTELTLEKEDSSKWQDCYDFLCEKHSQEIVDNVWSRHKKSQYKRNNLPIRIC